MAKWEHCRLFVAPRHGDQIVYIHYYDSKQGPQPLGKMHPQVHRQDDALQKAISDLGSDGWEMVTVFYIPEHVGEVDDRLNYYFKRRVE